MEIQQKLLLDHAGQVRSFTLCLCASLILPQVASWMIAVKKIIQLSSQAAPLNSTE